MAHKAIHYHIQNGIAHTTRIHTKVQTKRPKENHKGTLQVQGSGNSRRTFHAGPRASSSRDSFKAERKLVHGIPEGLYVSTVGLNTATVEKYIREQEMHDQMVDKLSVKEGITKDKKTKQ